jgi:hypothetical protein
VRKTTGATAPGEATPPDNGPPPDTPK